MAAPGAPVRAPAVVKRLDYEGELAVVMGPGGEVAGYAVADDLTARDLQRAERQWTRAKGFDGSCPFGPWITTADEVAEPGDLALRTWINGELRQDSRTSDLIFGVPEIVAFIRETITLEPGDLILTGTPSGVGMYFDPPRFLGSGDVVRIEIEALGVDRARGGVMRALLAVVAPARRRAGRRPAPRRTRGSRRRRSTSPTRAARTSSRPTRCTRSSARCRSAPTCSSSTSA